MIANNPGIYVIPTFKNKNLYLDIFIANNHEPFYLMFYMGYSDD